tara:strand:+ start:973 stop:2688 length:1716 start_codon:yes stop_codon:yes gene_type:complete
MSGAPRHGGEKSFKEYAMAQDYEINVKVKGVDQAKSSVDNLTDSMNEAGEASGAAFSKLDSMLGGVPSKIKGAVGGVKNLAGGFKSLRAAIISTGIGALVVALASLATFFTKTQRGAEMLEKAQAGLGAAFAVITDKVSALGEGLINVFTNPIESIKGFADSIKTFVIDKVQQLIDGFGVLGSAVGALFRGEFSEAAELAKEGFMKVGDSVLALNPATAVLYQVGQAAADIAPDIMKAANAAVQLSDDAIKLRQAQRDLAVEFAEGRKEIKRYNLIAEDTTKTFDERIEAAQRAIDIEKSLMAERLKNAEEELRIHNEQMALSESTEEDLERRKDLEVALLNAQTESFEMQTTLNNKLNTLEAARTADIEAQQKIRNDAIDANLAEQDKKEEEAAKRRIEREKKTEEAIAALKTQAISSTFSILKNLTDASEKDTEKSAKKAFNRNKAISVAETLVNTYMAAQKAYASQIIPLDPSSIIRAQIAAGIAVASGLAKVAAIKSTQFSGGGGGGSASAGGVSGGGGGGSVGVDVGSLVPNTATPTPEPVRAYVVSNEISNQQALDRELQIQTTL